MIRLSELDDPAVFEEPMQDDLLVDDDSSEDKSIPRPPGSVQRQNKLLQFQKQATEHFDNEQTEEGEEDKLEEKATHDISDEKRDSSGRWQGNNTSNDALTFASREDANAWLDEKAAPPFASVSAEEKDAAGRYKMESYPAVNKALRDGNLSGFKVKEHVAALDSLLSKNHLDQAVVVHRVIYKALGTKDAQKFLDNFVAERSFVDPAYVSTSAYPLRPSPRPGHRLGTMDIIVPKGTPAVSLDKFGGMLFGGETREGELLLGRNTRFKVRSVTKNPNGEVHAVLEVSNGG